MLARHWKNLVNDLQGEHSLNLRDAANVIGFHAFPLGWSWNEYELKHGKKRRPYEDRIQKAVRLGRETLKPDPPGIAAIQAATCYRRATVELKLRALVAQREVRLYIYEHNCRGRVAGERETLDAALTFDIEGSGVYDPPYAEDAYVSGPDLLTYLNLAESPWKTRSSYHDWFLVERLVRDFLSTYGCHLPDQEIMRRCEDEYSAANPEKPLDKTQYAQLTRELRLQYGFSVEKLMRSTEAGT